MGMNAAYRGPEDCPSVIPVFPLPGALLLPRGQMPLNIFEPRYLAMVDEALRGDRVIGMMQPDADNDPDASVPKLYRGRLRRPHHAIRGDRRRPLPCHADRHLALPHRRGAARRSTRIGRCRVDFEPFSRGFRGARGRGSRWTGTA